MQVFFVVVFAFVLIFSLQMKIQIKTVGSGLTFKGVKARAVRVLFFFFFSLLFFEEGGTANEDSK